MKSDVLMQELYSLSTVALSRTVDACKAGDPEREVSKVAVCCFPSVGVIRTAQKWGAELLITHEPLYYDHYDRAAHDDSYTSDPIVCAKKKLIEETGMTVYRFHDFAHNADPDLIAAGELRASGLKGRYEKGNFFAVNRFILDEAMTARELAAHFEKTLGIHHIRIAGNADFKGRNLGLGFGTPGHMEDAVLNETTDFFLTGEADEWNGAEYVRDAAELGRKKAMLVMSHCGSERAGMHYCADLLRQRHPELEVLYIESPEVYTYTD